MTVDEGGVVATGAVLFAAAWLPWYEVRVAVGTLTYRAWDLGFVAVVAVLLSLYAGARTVWLRFRPLGPEVPLAPGVEPLGATLLAMVLLAYRSLVPPADGAEPAVGLALATTVVLLQVVFAGRIVRRTGIRA